jgi:hypothetical protein
MGHGKGVGMAMIRQASKETAEGDGWDNQPRPPKSKKTLWVFPGPSAGQKFIAQDSFLKTQDYLF